MNPETVAPPSTVGGGSPLRDNWRGALFLLILLVIAGVTATAVGYKVKSADWERKRTLRSTYESLGGSFERAMTPGTTIVTDDLSEAQKKFALIYELNQRTREYGLIKVLQTTSSAHLDLAIATLSEIGASEAARTVEDTRKALSESTPDGQGNPIPSAKALRFARQYGRPMTRETEARLFAYIRTIASPTYPS